MTQETNSDLVLRVRQAHALRETDPVRAFEEFRALSDQGYPDGMLQLAWCYEEGIGTTPDMALAKMWYGRAYETGSEEVKKQATIYLGRFYLRQKDFAKAYEIYSAGAVLNYSPAIYNLGRLYWHGLGVKKQPREARKLFERASKQGHLLAKRNLAVLLMSGRFGIFNIATGLYLLLQSIKEIWVVADKSLSDEHQDERIM